MPRFFFHLYDDIVARDEDGLELPDAEAARQEALRAARALAAEEVSRGRLVLHHRIEVEAEDGVIARISFGDALTIEP